MDTTGTSIPGMDLAMLELHYLTTHGILRTTTYNLTQNGASYQKQRPLTLPPRNVDSASRRSTSFSTSLKQLPWIQGMNFLDGASTENSGAWSTPRNQKNIFQTGIIPALNQLNNFHKLMSGNMKQAVKYYELNLILIWLSDIDITNQFLFDSSELNLALKKARSFLYYKNNISINHSQNYLLQCKWSAAKSYLYFSATNCCISWWKLLHSTWNK